MPHRADAAVHVEAVEFIKETGAEGTRYYRAGDDVGEVYAAFFEDGRVRVAAGERRYAGVLEGGRADLLDVETHAWNELFVRTTPENHVQLELRGTPEGVRILTCEPMA